VVGGTAPARPKGVDAAAGVVVTASHNPPADNGYKVFTAHGAQIVSPVDAEIAECIDLVDPCTVPLSEPDDPLIEWLDDSFVQAYLASVPAVRLCPEVAGVPVAYSAMHGVGGDTLMTAFDRAGLLTPFVVAEQQQPDPTFPTVSFPNPEEPGAMDLLLAKAAESIRARPSVAVIQARHHEQANKFAGGLAILLPDIVVILHGSKRRRRVIRPAVVQDQFPAMGLESG